MRIAVVANTAWYLLNFRLNLIYTLQQAGHQVVAIAPPDVNRAKQIRNAGVVFHPVEISGSGTNPFVELGSVFKLCCAFKKHRVDVVFSYTPKGNIYSSIAAKLTGAVCVPNISGVGGSFANKSFLGRLVSLLYRGTLGRAHQIFFQNMDDLNAFVSRGLAPAHKCIRLPGSGVELQRFQPVPATRPVANNINFLLVARLLWNKGVGEFADAARLVKQVYPTATFKLLGFLDVDNPTAVPREQVQAWVDEGLLQYLGSTDDVRPHLNESHCVVLPSYYGEGVPRTLLEAAATMRPVITTDSPGCRDTVVDGVTGYICKPKSAEDLAEKMIRFIELPFAEQLQMGSQGRLRIEQEFDEKIVLNAYSNVLKELEAR